MRAKTSRGGGERPSPCLTHSRSCDDVHGSSRVGVGQFLAAVIYLWRGDTTGQDHVTKVNPGSDQVDALAPVPTCPVSPGSCKSATDVHTNVRGPTAVSQPLKQKSGAQVLPRES